VKPTRSNPRIGGVVRRLDFALTDAKNERESRVIPRRRRALDLERLSYA
jgi:hypothetical protein